MNSEHIFYGGYYPQFLWFEIVSNYMIGGVCGQGAYGRAAVFVLDLPEDVSSEIGGELAR